MEIRLVPDESENGNYNQNIVQFVQIQKIFRSISLISDWWNLASFVPSKGQSISLKTRQSQFYFCVHTWHWDFFLISQFYSVLGGCMTLGEFFYFAVLFRVGRIHDIGRIFLFLRSYITLGIFFLFRSFISCWEDAWHWEKFFLFLRSYMTLGKCFLFAFILWNL